MTPRRRLAPESRRAELLDAATEVILAARGAPVRVEDVTEAAGTAKGTFYLYFESWEAMLIALRDRVIADFRHQAEQRLTQYEDPLHWWVWAETEIRSFLDFQVDQGPLHIALFHGPISRVPLPSDLAATEFIVGMLERGVREGVIRDVDLSTTAMLIFEMLHGAGDHVAAGADREATADAVLDLLRHGLEPR